MQSEQAAQRSTITVASAQRSVCAPSAAPRARLGVAAAAILMCAVGVSGCGASDDDSLATFAGTWAGPMTLSDGGAVQSIEVTIPDDCNVGEDCGETDNRDVSCVWGMTLDKVDASVLSYTFSGVKSAQDEELCQTGVGTSGTLTRQSDGTLQRVHNSPGFIASGALTKQG